MIYYSAIVISAIFIIFIINMVRKNKLDENLHYVKIKIGKNSSKQQYSLSCILVILNCRNNEIETNGFENLRFYLLFPIRCGDFH